MKNLKLAILAFAALGLALEISEFDGFKAALTHPFANDAAGLIMIGGFVLPLVMGILGMMRPPLQGWQAIVALAGFVAIGVKIKVWDAVIHVNHQSTKGILLLVAIVGGVIVSALATAKPEARA